MINLLLVEDNDKLRPAMREGLEATGGVRVLYDCGSGEEMAVGIVRRANLEVFIVRL